MKTRPDDLRQRTFDFAIRVVKLWRHLEGRNGVSRVLARQLLRAGTSVGANVEEAQAAQSKPDFINKNPIALKEARETHYWLRLLAASEELPAQRVADGRIDAHIRCRGRIGTKGSQMNLSVSFFLFPFTFFLLPYALFSYLFPFAFFLLPYTLAL